MFTRVWMKQTIWTLCALCILALGAPSRGDATWASLSLAGHYGGQCYAVAAEGTVAYAGFGPDLVILDVANPAAPVRLAKVTLPAVIQGLAVAAGRLYAADGEGGLQILDVANPARPERLCSMITSPTPYNVTVVGSTLYLAGGAAGLQIYNVSDPRRPVLLSRYDTAGETRGVTVAGTRAYLADGPAGLQILDVSNPAAPKWLGGYDTLGFASAVLVSGIDAFVADSQGGLVTVDISNLSRLRQVDRNNIDARAIQPMGQRAVVSGSAGFYILNLPPLYSSPQIVGHLFLPEDSRSGLAFAGDFAFVADGSGGLLMVNLNDPAHPALAAVYGRSGALSQAASADSMAYLSSTEGLHIIDLAQPADPLLRGAYAADLFGGPLTVANGVAYAKDRLIDVRDPAHPYPISDFMPLNASSSLKDIAVQDDTAYLLEANRLHLFDVRNPWAPARLGGMDIPDLTCMAVAGHDAYCGVPGGFWVVDTGNPNFPKTVGSLNFAGQPTSMAFEANRIYCNTDSIGLVVADVSVPAKPVLRGTCALTDTIGTDIAPAGDLVYVSSVFEGLTAIDVRNAAAPVPLGRYPILGVRTWSVSLSGGLLLAANQDSGLWIFHALAPSALSRAGYVVTRLQVGRKAYQDRDWNFDGPVPAELFDQLMIRTLNDDKNAVGDNFLSFRLNQPARVWVAHDTRITTPPAWLAGWVKTGPQLRLTDGTRRNLFVKDFGAGLVRLGGNRNPALPAGPSMYTVFLTPLPPPLNAAQGWALYK